MRKKYTEKKASICTLHTYIKHVQGASFVPYLNAFFLAMVRNTRI